MQTAEEALAEQQGRLAPAIAYTGGPPLLSAGPRNVGPRLDSHAFLPLPEGWILCHDPEGRLYRARLDTRHSQWRHPEADSSPAPMHMLGIRGPQAVRMPLGTAVVATLC